MNKVDYNSNFLKMSELISEEGSSDNKMKGDLEKRVINISLLLNNNPGLRDNLELTGQIWTFLDKNNALGILRIAETLLNKTYCNINVLTLSKDELEQYGDNFWRGIIRKHQVKKLIIKGGDKQIEYNERVLRQLVERRPQIKTLTEVYTIELNDKKIMVETAATLLLCGSTFEAVFSPLSNEYKKKIVRFNLVSSEIFTKIIEEVKSGKVWHRDDKDKIACEYLDYTRWIDCFKGAFGPDLWERYYGIKIEDEPLVPSNILEVIKKSEANKTEKLIFIPKGMTLSKIGELVENSKSGHITSYNEVPKEIMDKYGKQEVEQSYWILMSTEIIGRGKSRAKQLEMAREKKGCDAPSLLEAAILNFTTYTVSKTRLFNDKPWTFTVCKEDTIQDLKLAVGGYVFHGLNIILDDDNDNNGVSPVLK